MFLLDELTVLYYIFIAAWGRFGRKLKGAGNGQHEAPGTRIFQNVRISTLLSPRSTVAT
jgi:hypothetical protein